MSTRIVSMIVAASLGAAVMTATASAAVVSLPYVDGFQSDTVGQAPANWNVSETGATAPQLLADAHVVDTAGDAHPSPDPAGTKAFQIQNQAATSVNFTPVTSGPVTVQFDLRLNSQPANYQYRINISGNGTLATYLLLNPTGGGTPGFSYYNASATSPNGNHYFTLVGNSIVGDWYRFIMTPDLSTNTWSVSVSNLTAPGAGQSGSGSNIPMFATVTNFNQFGLVQVSPGNTIDATIDNVHIGTVVPEPTTMGLLSIGGLLLLRQRR